MFCTRWRRLLPPSIPLAFLNPPLPVLSGHPPGLPLLLGAVCLAATVVGCAEVSRTVSEPVPPPPSFSGAGTAELPERWWTALGDADLNAAVDTALVANFDLRTAWERLREAQAVTDRTAAFLFPSLEASADGEVSRPEDDDRSTEALRLGMAAVYEVDLWGRIRSQVQAEQLRAEATLADYQTAALSLSAEIARTWAQLAEAQNQVALVDQQIETNTTVLELLENRFGTGQVRAVDLLRQRQLIESTREQRTIAESRRQVLKHQLAVLLGRPPQSGPGVTPTDLPELPPLPDTGVPLDLVQRRPDVRRAFLQLQAADRDVASAISNQFPRLTLTASTSTAAQSVGNLFQDWMTTLAGNLLAPLFYGGELRAEVDRTQAVRQQRLFAYGQTTLTAFQEVEDALVRELRQRDRIVQIDAQIELAEQAYAQLQVEYFNGTSNYLDVLTALDEVQALRRDRLAAQLTLTDIRITLYRALAGSFSTARETEP